MPLLPPRRAAVRSAALACAAMLTLAVWTAPALAGRFGPPWMALVTADETTLYAGPDRSDPVGPLPKGAMVVVTEQQGDMTHTPDGWVPSADVAEATEPWIAEVSAGRVAVYAKPNAGGD